MKIIVVEDEGITRQWIKKKIEELGEDYQAGGVFSNGNQALEYLRQHEVDVVFTDIKMPVMDGLELLEHMSKIKHPSYKVILSAYDEFHYVRRALQLGAHEYMLKAEITGEGLQKILEEARAYLSRQQPRKQDEDQRAEEKARRETFLRRLLENTDVVSEKPDVTLESRFAEYGISLALEKFIFIDIYFEKTIEQEHVLELLDLYLEQEKLQGVAVPYGIQEFILLYNFSDFSESEEQLRKLAEILQIHTGTCVYLGVSRQMNRNKMGSDGYQSQVLLIRELFRQAVVARDNRRFFGIMGYQLYECMRITVEREETEFCFNQDKKSIIGCLNQEQYEEAAAGVRQFVTGLERADYLHPAYVRALCNEILVAYLQCVWNISLNPDEKIRVAEIELLFGNTALDLKGLQRAMIQSSEYITKLLERKGIMGKYSVSIRKILQYVEEHYGERISLEQVADQVHLSRSYVSGLFRKETGQRFSSYLQEVRLEKSCELLKDARYSIQEVAGFTGFFDAAHFSHAFKERYGISPMEYRKNGVFYKKT